MINRLLTLLLLNGYPVLFGVVLVGSVGVPIPTDLFVLAAGGFAAQGELAVGPVAALTFAAAVGGDCAVYLVARALGEAANVPSRPPQRKAAAALGSVRLLRWRRW